MLGASGFLHGTALRALEYVAALGLILVVVARVLHRGQNKREFSDAGLYGVLGRMGSGKSYFLAFVAWLAAKQGRQIFANYELTGSRPWSQYMDYVNYFGRVDVLDKNGKRRGWVPVKPPKEIAPWSAPVVYESWIEEVIQVPNGSLVLVDEVHLWWSSQQWRVPKNVEAWITQLRKRRITVFWASQDVRSVSRRLRGLTFAIWEANRYKQGHVYTLYEPIQAGRETTQKRPHVARVTMMRKKSVMAFYDTYGVVGSSEEWGGDELVPTPTDRREGRGAPAPVRLVGGGEK
jgi:hypothetical protein